MIRECQQHSDKCRFNRYMVECEYRSHIVLMNQFTGFNRYMVECELKMTARRQIQTLCFNRCMVECECAYDWHS